MNSITYTLSDIDSAANRFLSLTHGHRHFAFSGTMGAGKTTFIKALCHALGVTQTVTSPTFALVNQYHARDVMVYHFDFYRIREPKEVFDFGCEEYFETGGYCFIEWPEKAEIALPSDVCNIRVEEINDTTRKIVIGD